MQSFVSPPVLMPAPYMSPPSSPGGIIMASAPESVTMNPLARARSLNSEPPGGVWDYFLSHYQLNGGASMLALSEMMEKRGRSCWCAQAVLCAAVVPTTRSRPICCAARRAVRLDKNSIPNEDGMMDGIARSRYFLLYLTRGVFTRPFVQKEVRRALQLGKPIILLWEKEERGQVYRDAATGETQSTVATLKELMDEMPRHGTDPSRGEFSAVFDKCVCVPAQFHADARVRDAMLDAICDTQRSAFVVPWPPQQ